VKKTIEQVTDKHLELALLSRSGRRPRPNIEREYGMLG
jgi:hypothetical protein